MNFCHVSGIVQKIPNKTLYIRHRDGQTEKIVIVIDSMTQYSRWNEEKGKNEYRTVWESLKCVLYGKKVKQVKTWSEGDFVSITGKLQGRIERIKGKNKVLNTTVFIGEVIYNMTQQVGDDRDMMFVDNSLRTIGIKEGRDGVLPESQIRKRSEIDEEFPDIEDEDDYWINL